jgi:dynactin 1
MLREHIASNHNPNAPANFTILQLLLFLFTLSTFLPQFQVNCEPHGFASSLPATNKPPHHNAAAVYNHHNAASLSPAAMADYKLGQTVETNDGRTGLIRYIGEIHVSPGQFLGIELPTAAGKNDGSVKGERYFQCPAMHGLFVKTTGISKIIAQPQPKPIGKAPRQSLRPTSLVRPGNAPPNPSQPTKRTSIVPLGQQASSRPVSKRLSVATSSSASQASSTKPLGRAPSTATKPTPSTQPSSTTSKAPRGQQDQSGLVDDLQTQIRHLQKQYDDAKGQLKELHSIKGEKDRYEAIMQKLQAKCQTYHQEVADLKSQHKSVHTELERLSRTEQEAESVLELATLDREMAEERAEQAEAELESLRLRLEEVELELNVVTLEREVITDEMSDEAKLAASYRQLQSERNRLKDAILYLREITEQTEAGLRTRIRELEAEQVEAETLKEEQTAMRTQITQLESTVDDMRQQLDAANAWEEIIEDLSDQNQQFKEQLAEKEGAIRDLENLKELNDELETHHIEQANELRAELEAVEVDLAEQTQKVAEQDASISEQENLITKFRDLVIDLQAKMNDAESSKTMSDEQAKDVTGRFNEVMELNRRLRNATLNSTVKTITSELQKMQANEAQEELAIVKHYLPDSSDVYKNDSLRAYFRAKRLDFMSALTSSLMKNLGLEKIKIKDADNHMLELLRVDCIHQLDRLNIKSNQVWAAMSTATLEQFVSFGPAYEDFGLVERSLVRCVEGLKKDDIGFKETSQALRTAKSVLYATATDFKDILARRPEDELIFRVSSIKNSLGLINTTFGVLRMCVMHAHTEGEWFDTILSLLNPSSEAQDSIVAAEKLLRTLETLRADLLYPRFPNGMEEVIQQDESLEKAADVTVRFAMEFIQYLLPFHDETTIHASDLEKAAANIQDKHFTDEHIVVFSNIVAKLKQWNEYGSVLMNNVEIEHGPPPWVVKAQEIEAAKKQSADAERLLQIVSLEHNATKLQIREREEIIETKELEIEHLRAKHREAIAKVERCDHLQNELKAAQQEHDQLKTEIKQQSSELERLRERASVSDRSEAIEARPATPTGAANAVPEKTAPRADPHGTLFTFLEALTNENHWLRRRENSEMFGHNLKEMFARIRDSHIAKAKKEARRKQNKADEMLAMSLALEQAEVAPSTPARQQEHTIHTPDKLATLLPQLYSPIHRRGRSPILLTPLQTSLSWKPDASTPSHFYAELEDGDYEDLSPIAEEFAMEVSDALEEISFIDPTSDSP